jgi:hypothetical protein
MAANSVGPPNRGRGAVRGIAVTFEGARCRHLPAEKIKGDEWAYKPNSVPRADGVAIISLGRRLRGASSDLPEDAGEQPVARTAKAASPTSCLVLLPVGFA